MREDEAPALTSEQLAYIQRIYHISTSISQTFKDMLEVAVRADDISIIKPFIVHILAQCDEQAKITPIQTKSGLVNIDGEEI